MTLPQNVKDAVKSLECEIADPEDCTAWQIIRAHLMSQEAELADYKNASLHAADDCVAKDAEIDRLQTGLAKHVARACELESRLAAANALLRDIRDWDVAQALGPTREKTLFALPIKLRSRLAKHLQGAGDEGGRPA